MSVVRKAFFNVSKQTVSGKVVQNVIKALVARSQRACQENNKNK